MTVEPTRRPAARGRADRRAVDRRAVDRRAVDARLAEAHAAMVTDLADLLDLDAGVRDALLPGAHAALAAGLAGLLDLDAGLALILPPRVALLPDPAVIVSTDEVTASTAHQDTELRPIAGLLTLSAEARLRLRGTQAFDALTGVFMTLAAVAERHDLADGAIDLASQVSRVLARLLDLARVQVLAHEPASGAATALALARETATSLEVDLSDAHALGLDLDRDAIHRRATDLTTAVIQIRTRGDLGFGFESDLLLARVLAHDLALLLQPSSGEDPCLVSHLAHPLSLARVRLMDHDLSRVRTLTRGLPPDLAEALETVLSSDFLTHRAGTYKATPRTDSDTDEKWAAAWASAFQRPTPDPMFWLSIPEAITVGDALVVQSCLTELTRIRDDFTSADLHDADIGGVHLDGVRWSLLTTRWPEDRLPEIERRSTPLHPARPDILVIRSGNIDTRDPVIR